MCNSCCLQYKGSLVPCFSLVKGCATHAWVQVLQPLARRFSGPVEPRNVGKNPPLKQFGKQVLPQQLWLVKLHIRMLWLLNCLIGTTFELSCLAHTAMCVVIKWLMVADVQRELVKLLWSEKSGVPAHIPAYQPVIPTVSSCSSELGPGGVLVCSRILTKICSG